MDDKRNIDVKGLPCKLGDSSEEVEFHNITPTAAEGSFSEQHDEKLGLALDAMDKKKTKRAFVTTQWRKLLRRRTQQL
jgi:hypothetical protein